MANSDVIRLATGEQITTANSKLHAVFSPITSAGIWEGREHTNNNARSFSFLVLPRRHNPSALTFLQAINSKGFWHFSFTFSHLGPTTSGHSTLQHEILLRVPCSHRRCWCLRTYLSWSTIDDDRLERGADQGNRTIQFGPRRDRSERRIAISFRYNLGRICLGRCCW
jgi:hypothetical protein